jgi:threonine dehydrogenase-like Zn-dependent dehydrogenase
LRALTFTGRDALEWREEANPKLGSDVEALVRPIAVATCDLDAIILAGQSPFQAPFAIGHEGVAEVVELGDVVTGLQPGDRVCVPFQVSCGTCAPCLDGRTGHCASVPFSSTYGFGFGDQYWGGFLADLVRVPYADHMLVPLPERVDPAAAASASDNISDGHRTVAGPLAQWPGAPVLVVGGAGPGSVGLYAAGQALALGAERVLYVDEDPNRRVVAEALGADTLDSIPERVDDVFPVTVDASANPRGLELALRSTAPDGTCTSTGIYFDREDPPLFPLLEMYVKNTVFITGRPHVRPVMPAALDLIEAGRFDPAEVTTRTVAWDDASDALVARDWTKLVISR